MKINPECKICHSTDVLGIIARNFPDTMLCGRCIKDLNKVFVGCHNTEERIERLKLVNELFKDEL